MCPQMFSNQQHFPTYRYFVCTHVCMNVRSDKNNSNHFISFFNLYMGYLPFTGKIYIKSGCHKVQKQIPLSVQKEKDVITWHFCNFYFHSSIAKKYCASLPILIFISLTLVYWGSCCGFAIIFIISEYNKYTNIKTKK